MWAWYVTHTHTHTHTHTRTNSLSEWICPRSVKLARNFSDRVGKFYSLFSRQVERISKFLEICNRSRPRKLRFSRCKICSSTWQTHFCINVYKTFSNGYDYVAGNICNGFENVIRHCENRRTIRAINYSSYRQS